MTRLLPREINISVMDLIRQVPSSSGREIETCRVAILSVLSFQLFILFLFAELLYTCRFRVFCGKILYSSKTSDSEQRVNIFLQKCGLPCRLNLLNETVCQTMSEDKVLISNMY